MVAFLCFLHKNAVYHLYYTETGEPDVLVVFGMIRPKLEPASDVDIAHSPKKIFHGEKIVLLTHFFFHEISVSRDHLIRCEVQIRISFQDLSVQTSCSCCSSICNVYTFNSLYLYESFSLCGRPDRRYLNHLI